MGHPERIIYGLMVEREELIAQRDALLEAAEALESHRALHLRSDHPKANMFCSGCPEYFESLATAIVQVRGEI